MSNVSETPPDLPAMTPYDAQRWAELQKHWAKKAERRQLLPPKAREALGKAGGNVKTATSKAGDAVSNATPTLVKDNLEKVADAALIPAAKSAVHLLELVTDWTTELMDPEKVLEHHRIAGRSVTSLEELKALDMEHLDDYTRTMALKWRTAGAVQGGAMGTLAMVPFAGGVAAIGLDLLVMHVLSTALATRVAYSYGYDVTTDEMRHHVDRMVQRAYRNQAAKVGTAHQASAAFNAAKDRVRWSEKLRNDHKLMAAVEKLMKKVGGGKAVPVGNVAKAMPVIAIVAGAGTNAHVLGDVVHQARLYSQTLYLADKYGLDLPGNLRQSDDEAIES